MTGSLKISLSQQKIETVPHSKFDAHATIRKAFKYEHDIPSVLFHVPIYTSCLFVSCHFAFEKDLAKIESSGALPIDINISYIT